jgi:hypothetical protein
VWARCPATHGLRLTAADDNIDPDDAAQAGCRPPAAALPLGQEHAATRLHCDEDRAGRRGSPRAASLAGAKTGGARSVSARGTARTVPPVLTQNA